MSNYCAGTEDSRIFERWDMSRKLGETGFPSLNKDDFFETRFFSTKYIPDGNNATYQVHRSVRLVSVVKEPQKEPSTYTIQNLLGLPTFTCAETTLIINWNNTNNALSKILPTVSAHPPSKLAEPNNIACWDHHYVQIVVPVPVYFELFSPGFWFLFVKSFMVLIPVDDWIKLNLQNQIKIKKYIIVVVVEDSCCYFWFNGDSVPIPLLGALPPNPLHNARK